LFTCRASRQGSYRNLWKATSGYSISFTPHEAAGVGGSIPKMTQIPRELLILWLAVAIDLALGEPSNAWHPVAWMGRLIAGLLRAAPRSGAAGPFIAGLVLVICGAALMALGGFWLQTTLARLPLPWDLFAQAVVLKSAFSIRALATAGSQVKRALVRGDLPLARKFLRWHLVSRDTQSLGPSQVAAATIESLAENASDGCVAPLFFYVVAGLPGALVYRFVNTCDAMLGYRDAEHEWLGKAAARTDDLANLVPARLTATLILALGLVRGAAGLKGVAVWKRDRLATASPNAGHPMSAAAGVLGLELEKTGHYRLGTGQPLPDTLDIGRALRLVWCTMLLAIALFSTILFMIHT